jgi:hypothetical protein
MKKNFFLFLSLFLGLFLCAGAQTKSTVDNLKAYSATADTTQGWKHSGLVGLTFGQTSLNNWVAGGDNTVAGNVIFNLTAKYKHDKWFWDNNLAGEYGMIYSSTLDWQKAADRLTLTSIAGKNITDRWAAALLLNFNTQFAKGYNYPNKDNYISTFMAPAYTDVALGFTYKPNPKYTLFLSPIAERVTMVFNDSLSSIGAFGVSPGKKTKWESGAYIMATTNQTLFENVSLISTLDLFTPYNENFGNVDINWNLLVSCKISKMFTATLNTTLRYYDAEIQKIQWKQILGLGVTYSF